jgi:hypothetical protein
MQVSFTDWLSTAVDKQPVQAVGQARKISDRTDSHQYAGHKTFSTGSFVTDAQYFT